MCLAANKCFDLCILLLSLFSMSIANAQGGQDLGQAANDPTASLLSAQLHDLYSGDFHNLDDASQNTILFRGVVPFKTEGISHVSRINMPVITSSPFDKTGFGDVIVSDLLVQDQDWGRWGGGIVGLFPTASDSALGTGKWGAGPAFGFTAQNPLFIWGVFNQNLFSFAGEVEREDVNISTLQPIFNYSLPEQWSVGTSEMNLTYDWDQGQWTLLPIGAKASKVVKLGKMPTQFSAAYEANLADDFVTPSWTLNLAAKFLFP